jgi:chromosomal replication initiator protein
MHAIPRRSLPTAYQVVVIVADLFGMNPMQLVSSDRHKTVALARQLAMFIVRQELKHSYPEIGRCFGGRDHTTAMSAVRKIGQLVNARDPFISATLTEALVRLTEDVP